MDTLIPQFKIKCCLERGELARVAYVNFFKVNVPAKHKTPRARETVTLFLRTQHATEHRKTSGKANNCISFTFWWTFLGVNKPTCYFRYTIKKKIIINL